jgi:enamine deaminase RidA (YjgF/YER057c/UK114 family)
MHHEVVHGPSMPQPMGHYSQAVRAGDLVFVAGQPGIDLGASAIRPLPRLYRGDSRPSGVKLSGISRQY